ncbi:MAG: CotH kinase family protein, partial [bacterium]
MKNRYPKNKNLSCKRLEPALIFFLVLSAVGMSLLPGVSGLLAVTNNTPEIVINEFLALNQETKFDRDGDSSDWIELFNAGSESVDVQGFTLTDDPGVPGQWTLPSVTLAPGDFLLVWASGKDLKGSELHANFKLSALGEFIGLYAPSGIALDSVHFDAQTVDVSLARIPDGSGDFRATAKPTPGTANKSEAPSTSGITFSPGSGFYNGSVQVVLTTGIRGGDIRYTLDGSTVTSSSRKVTAPLTLSSTRVLRARVFKNGRPKSADISQIYAVDYEGRLPVLSLATDESNLFGSRGIYSNPKKRGRSWEREVSVNLLETDSSGFQINAGLRIHGQHSRGRDSSEFPKKSMRLYFRSDYGESKLRYRVFAQKNLKTFDQLLVHSGGSFDQYFDNNKWTLLRDPLNHTLWHEQDGAISASRPVVVFINGEVWGIYQIRERTNEDFVRDNYGVEDMDLLDWHHRETPDISAGDLERWNELYRFFLNNDLSSDAKYRQTQQWIDLENFVDFQIIEIYAGNKDWPHNNNFFFRERSPDAKWRWILWDSESTYQNSKIKLLEWATRDKPRQDISLGDHEGQLFGTLFLRKLLANDNFKEFFINRFADLLNTTLNAEHVREVFDRMATEIEPDVGIEAEHWGVPVSQWHAGVRQVRDFIKERSRIQRNHLESFFRLSGESELTVNVNPPGSGRVRVNTLTHSGFPWTGSYFNGNAVTLEAFPNAGFRFKAWNGVFSQDTEVLKLNLKNDLTVTATFADTNASIQVVSPNGGEEWLIGESRKIMWSFQHVDSHVRIELSADNGVTWTTVSASTENDGVFNWQVPDVPSTQCLIRVSQAGSGDPVDSSDAVFSIRKAEETPSAPSIVAIAPSSGPVGTVVTLKGVYFSGATEVQFDSVSASSFTVEADSVMRANVPTGATSGAIRVITPFGAGVSPGEFTVTDDSPAQRTPVILSFAPERGSAGAEVTLFGSHFTDVLGVFFNETPADSFRVESDSLMRTDVPAGATSGSIRVITPFGAGVSPGEFTVTDDSPAQRTPVILSFAPERGSA